MTFKVGDTIICIKSVSDSEPGCPVAGQISVVKSVSTEWIGVECPDLNYDYSMDKERSEGIKNGTEPEFCESCFRLATPEEIVYFNFPNKLLDIIS